MTTADTPIIQLTAGSIASTLLDIGNTISARASPGSAMIVEVAVALSPEVSLVASVGLANHLNVEMITLCSPSKQIHAGRLLKAAFRLLSEGHREVPMALNFEGEDYTLQVRVPQPSDDANQLVNDLCIGIGMFPPAFLDVRPANGSADTGMDLGTYIPVNEVGEYHLDQLATDLHQIPQKFLPDAKHLPAIQEMLQDLMGHATWFDDDEDDEDDEHAAVEHYTEDEVGTSVPRPSFAIEGFGQVSATFSVLELGDTERYAEVTESPEEVSYLTVRFELPDGEVVGELGALYYASFVNYPVDLAGSDSDEDYFSTFHHDTWPPLITDEAAQLWGVDLDEDGAATANLRIKGIAIAAAFVGAPLFAHMVAMLKWFAFETGTIALEGDAPLGITIEASRAFGHDSLSPARIDLYENLFRTTLGAVEARPVNHRFHREGSVAGICHDHTKVFIIPTVDVSSPT